MKGFSDSGLGSILKSAPGRVAPVGRTGDQVTVTPTCRAPRHRGGNSSPRSPESWTDDRTETWPGDPGKTQPWPRCAGVWAPLLEGRGGEGQWARGRPWSEANSAGLFAPPHPHASEDATNTPRLRQMQPLPAITKTHSADFEKKKKKNSNGGGVLKTTVQRQAGEAMSSSEWDRDVWGSPSACRRTPQRPSRGSDGVCVCPAVKSRPTVRATPRTAAHQAAISSVHGISQARILEWVAISSSRGSSRPRDRICTSCIARLGRQALHHRATREAHELGWNQSLIPSTPFIRESMLKFI